MKSMFFSRYSSILYLTLFFSASFFISLSYGDTVILNTGKQIKGLVVDEYVDHIVVSTFSGEKTYLRTDIKDINYEEEETRLLKLAEKAMSQNKYENAIYYYKQVLKLNPNSKRAKDGQGIAIRKNLAKGAEIAKEEIELMVSLENINKTSAVLEKTLNEKNVKELLGLNLRMNDKNKVCYVDNVVSGSPASGYDIKRNDAISTAWNESVKYMPYEALLNKLAGPEFSMIKLGIERKIDFFNPKRLRWSIGLDADGYFVKGVYGTESSEKKLISSGDRLLEINSKPTRYMLRKDLEASLNSNEKSMTVIVKKEFYITRSKRR